MPALTYQRCFNHAAREAVARCPECQQFFCRECITEHDDRVLCAACLKKLARVPLRKRRSFVVSIRLTQCAASILLAWFFFFLIGETLARKPQASHKGTLWRVPWLNQR